MSRHHVRDERFRIGIVITAAACALMGCAHRTTPSDAHDVAVSSAAPVVPPSQRAPAVPAPQAAERVPPSADDDCAPAPALRCDTTRALRPLGCASDAAMRAMAATSSPTDCRPVRDASIPGGFTVIACDGAEDGAHGATLFLFDDARPYEPLAELNGPPDALEGGPRFEVRTVEGFDILVIDSESFDHVMEYDDEDGEVRATSYRRSLTVCVRDPEARCPLVGVTTAYGFAHGDVSRATVRRRARRIGALAIDGARVAVVQRNAPEDFAAETTHFDVAPTARLPELDAAALRATIDGSDGGGSTALDWKRACARGVPSYAMARISGVTVMLSRSATNDVLYVQPMSSSATSRRGFERALTALLGADAAASTEALAPGARDQPRGVHSVLDRGALWLFAHPPDADVSACVVSERERAGMCDPVIDPRTRDASAALLGTDEDARRRALATLESACAHGDVRACTEVTARVVAAEDGVPTRGAIEALVTSCDYANAGACELLGYVAYRGLGVAQDLALAERAYTRACALGRGAGCGMLGEIVASAPEGQLTHDALDRYEQGCELEDDFSCDRRGAAALSGRLGATRSDEDASYFFAEACTHGSRTGCIVRALLASEYGPLAQHFAFDVRIGRSTHPRIRTGATCTLRAGVIDTWMSFVARCGDALLLSPTSYFVFTRDPSGAAIAVNDPVTSEGDGDVAIALDYTARTIRIADSAEGPDGAFVIEGRLEPSTRTP